jgi:hypothetical protein
MRNALALVLPPLVIVGLLFFFQNSLFLEHNQVQYLWYAAGAIGFLSIASIAYYHMMGESAKKTMFFLIAVVIIGFTAFLNVSLLYKNYLSPFHGPVHWHAEVTFDICGREYTLASHDISTDEPLHTHGDSWVHVETTPISLEDVELHKFFEYIGGGFDENYLAFPTDLAQAQGDPRATTITSTSLGVNEQDALITVRNGDLCNGRPGSLRMTVNGRPEPEMGSYVISPIEAGDIDKIKIIFGE